jgi:hypothetical protein
VPERQHGLDEPRHAGRGIEMAYVGLDGPDGAEAAPFGCRAKGPGQRGDLDRIAQRRAGAVRLHVAHGVGAHAGDGLGGADDARLPVHARRGVADLVGAVVVGGAALDDGMDRIAVAQGLVQSLEHDHAGAAAQHGAIGARVEGAAMPVGGQDGARLVQVAAVLQQVEPDAAGQRHVALEAEQRLAGHVHRRQRA